MSDVSGERLDWFWREWFLEDDHFDQTIADVSTRQQGATQHVVVTYGNLQRGVLPIRARFTFDDRSTQELDYPAEVWSTDTARYTRVYDFTGKRLVRIDLDPEHRLVDTDRSNDTWTR